MNLKEANELLNEQKGLDIENLKSSEDVKSNWGCWNDQSRQENLKVGSEPKTDLRSKSAVMPPIPNFLCWSVEHVGTLGK